jgi:multidrug transporter EmrE-like cation transporter
LPHKASACSPSNNGRSSAGWQLVNTALAFTLWNKSLQTLTAVESSIINGTMLPQIAILAWIFLDEPLGSRQIAGLALVAAGTLIVQLWRYLPISKYEFFPTHIFNQKPSKCPINMGYFYFHQTCPKYDNRHT